MAAAGKGGKGPLGAAILGPEAAAAILGHEEERGGGSKKKKKT